MSLIVSWSIVVLVHRWGIYFTVCTHNWWDQFNNIACNVAPFALRGSGTVKRLPRTHLRPWHPKSYLVKLLQHLILPLAHQMLSCLKRLFSPMKMKLWTHSQRSTRINNNGGTCLRWAGNAIRIKLPGIKQRN